MPRNGFKYLDHPYLLFPSILAQMFFARGVEQIGSARAGQFINLVPLFAAFLTVALLGETLQGFHFIGFGLIMGGIWLGAHKVLPQGRA